MSWLYRWRQPRAVLAALALLSVLPLAVASPAAPSVAAHFAVVRRSERGASPRPARLPASAQHWLNEALAAARRHQFDAAYQFAQRAAAAAPDNKELDTVQAYLRQRAVLVHLELAHADLLALHRNQAAVEYRTALALDSANRDARLGLLQLYPSAASPSTTDAIALRVKNAAPPIQIQPAAGVQSFHVRAGLRAIVAQVAAAYGLRAYVADQAPHRTFRFDLGRADFAEAMTALRDVTGLDWIPLDAHTLYFAETRLLNSVQPQALRTFYLPWVNDGAELTGVANVARTLLGIREITVDAARQSLAVRATPTQLDATERLLLDLRGSPGQVLLQFQILELDTTTARDLGLGLPDQFTMFALGPLLSELQQNSSLAEEILNLFNSGGLNGVLNSGQLSPSTLSQLQSISPLLQSPFVVFGGGATLMALSVPQFSANLTASNNRSSTLETALLRAESGQPAEMKIGEKYPIINASFSPINLSPAISSVIGNGSFIQPFPSFTYEDLGLDAKITPHIAPSGALSLQVSITVKTLSGSANNNIPILDSRELVSEVNLQNNEPVMLAGLLDREEMLSLSGLPGLGQIPGLGALFSVSNRQTMHDELAIVLTPHIVQLPSTASVDTWLPASLAPTSNGPVSIQPFPSRFPPSLLPGRGGPGRGVPGGLPPGRGSGGPGGIFPPP